MRLSQHVHIIEDVVTTLCRSCLRIQMDRMDPQRAEWCCTNEPNKLDS